MLLAFVSVVGFVLEDDPTLRAKVVDSALAQLPIVGAQLGDDVQPLTGSSVALAVGLAGALWAGLGVTLALGRAFEAVSDVPRVLSWFLLLSIGTMTRRRPSPPAAGP